jgi:universal stress protein E
MPRLQLRKMFCVIDPTMNHQRALSRAADVAKQVGADVHAYLAFLPPTNQPSDHPEAYREAEYARHRAWLNEIVAPFQAEGVAITTEVECANDWREALVEAANRSGADLVVRTSTRPTAQTRRERKPADWTM